MTQCKIIAEKTAGELESEIEYYLRNGWTLVNCFIDSKKVYSYRAAMVK
jgi:hypothetical protein